MTSKALGDLSSNYTVPGMTNPSLETWQPCAAGYRTFERTIKLGAGNALWERVKAEVMDWKVKTRSGFLVEQSPKNKPLSLGTRLWITAVLGPVTIREPVVIVDVVDESNRCGFSYGTLQGHPISGEEAFIVHRSGDEVFFTLRSVSRRGEGIWRFAYPAIRLLQPLFRRRYMRSLTQT